jgi:predicted metalloprotease with PDZ domain
MRTPRLVLLGSGLILAALTAAAQNATLEVDATDAPRNLLHARETIPVQPGPLTLFYPKWIPGEHAPDGPVTDVAGLHLSANGAPVAWRRDLTEMYALHLDVPAGVRELDLAFDFILPPESGGFSAGSSSTPDLAVVSWNQVVFYPLSARPDDFRITPSLRLPWNWNFATALQAREHTGGLVRFAPVALSRLVDSPVQIGAHTRRLNLKPGGEPAVFLNLAADSEAALEMAPETLVAYRRLVAEAESLFGATHYDHYDFLYTLSDHVAHFGLEHHQSSDDRYKERVLLDGDLRLASADLLPHEYVHSWNGKYRRPAGLATGDYSTPMRDDLLWVYEGLTEYYGKVLAARSGLRRASDFRDELANLAAYYDFRPGRRWRPLQDTADEAQLLYFSREDYDSLRRDTDYYDEGVLIWLEADALIREQSHGRRSLDDFCRKFYGLPSTPPEVRPYTADDVFAALNAVQAYDWAGFFRGRLQSLDPHAPLGGIERAGWKLAFQGAPTELTRAKEAARGNANFWYSVGLIVGEDGAIDDVEPDLPAAKAGLAPSMKLIAVNGRKYTPAVLRAALKDSLANPAPLALLAEDRDFYATYSVDYHRGERYPVLERDPAHPDLLAEIAAARTR